MVHKSYKYAVSNICMLSKNIPFNAKARDNYDGQAQFTKYFHSIRYNDLISLYCSHPHA